MARPRMPVVLVVIDGWGIAPPGPANAVELSHPVTMARLARDYPSTRLEASGPAVGLPEGQMGNSEVGHINIGAGRVVYQDFVRINRAVARRELGAAPAIRDLLTHVRTTGSNLHLLGLLGPGGVHSHDDHLFGLLEAAKEAGVTNVWIHHVLDGRDTPPRSALEFAKSAARRIRAIGIGRVATVSGRYWTMDRDKRWDRTERAYRMLTALEGNRAPDAAAAIEASYQAGTSDEFVEPTVLAGAHAIRPGDAVLVTNFRPDRVRQIVRALMDPAFHEFPTLRLGLRLVTMTLYDRAFDAFGVHVAFPPDHPRDTLGEVYAKLGLRQLRVAETEKYAHVTYFFNGGREDPFPGEERILVPSPKVATYDLQPAMSANEVTDALLARLRDTAYDLVVVNFANPDMVGHTGFLAPAIEACKVTDQCIGRIAEHCARRGYLLAITADHGNAESMVDPQGRPQTAHTTAPVPLILVHDSLKGLGLSRGGLASVAPTLLRVVGLEAPAAMDAPSLLDPVPPRTA